MHLVSISGFLRIQQFIIKLALAKRHSLAYLFYKFRIDHNLSRKALARKFGVGVEYLSRIESGGKFPSLCFCLKCARLFGVNPHYVKNRWACEAVERYIDLFAGVLDFFRVGVGMGGFDIRFLSSLVFFYLLLL